METFLKQLLDEFNIEQNKVVDNTMAKLLHNAKINALAKSIHASKQQIITIFQMYREKEDFKEHPLFITNANAKKQYEYSFDMAKFPNIRILAIKNLDKIGLTFNPDALSISGVPNMALTLDLHLVFVNILEENPAEDIKIVPFIVNADPRDLWLNKPSNQNDLYAKMDSDKYAGGFLDKRIVVASQRGRSHAHEGSFRDDHFYVSSLPKSWAVVAVADGAGSAKFSRQGSKIATEYIVETFNSEAILHELDHLCSAYYMTVPAELIPIVPINSQSVPESPSAVVDGSAATDIGETRPTVEERLLKIKSSIINILYKSVRDVHAALAQFAQQEGILLKDLNTTLIFALVKKFDFGYVALTFGVGDCPINVVIGDLQEVRLLNMLDVGEFGGGTRFITMPEIFNPNMGARFAINKFDNFSKLILMTDGIYDAKFITENKLEDTDAWKIFLQDLGGQNEEMTKVDFSADEGVEDQLLAWLDFWSKGNHDDRTLAIIY